MIFSSETPPSDFTPQQRAYLERMFRQTEVALKTVLTITPTTVYPERVRLGDVYYFQKVFPLQGINSWGLWAYVEGSWVKLNT